MTVRVVVKWNFQAEVIQESQQFENNFSGLSHSSNKLNPDQRDYLFSRCQKTGSREVSIDKNV